MKQYPNIRTREIEYDLLVNPSGIQFLYVMYYNKAVGPKVTRMDLLYKGYYRRYDGIRFYI